MDQAELDEEATKVEPEQACVRRSCPGDRRVYQGGIYLLRRGDIRVEHRCMETVGRCKTDVGW
ncbi:hypothetical protein BCS71_25855 [Vibrio lentus]